MKAPSARFSDFNAPLLAAVLTTLLCFALVTSHQLGRLDLPGLEGFEHNTIDARFKVRGKHALKNNDIVIVGFDDKLRHEAPDVFQKRIGWARFIDALAAYKPRAVGIDAFFASPEISLPTGVMDKVRAAHSAIDPKSLAASPLLKQAKEALGAVVEAARGDAVLVEALRRAGNIHLSVLFFLEGGERNPWPEEQPEPLGLRGGQYGEAVAVEQPMSRRPPRAEASIYGSLDGFARSSAGAGYTNVIKDSDGQVRSIYGVIEHGGRYYMPLGLAMARHVAKGDNELSYVVGETAIHMGDHALRVDARGIAVLGYLGPGRTFTYISAADVLTGKTPKADLTDKLVFVGYTDAARDRIATPFDQNMPGVEVHATFAHNALHGDLMTRADPLWTALAVLLLGLVISVFSLRRIRQQRAWLESVVALVLLGAWLVLAQILFEQGLVIDVVAPAASCVLVALATLSTALATEGREKARLRAAFSQYVTGSLVERIIEDPDQVRLGGVRRELSILFSDIRGFSRFSEGMEPDALSGFLNEYLTPMTELVMDNGGMLDKYIGDAVMAVYGAPLAMTDHAAASCRTALAMQTRLEELNVGWQARGLPRIDIGIGLNSGTVSVGNMGSEVRFDYTVMGDCVNLGARLEALTKEYRAKILLGQNTAAAAGDGFVLRELDLVRVKGRAGSVQVYELLGEAGGSPISADQLPTWDAALARYRQRDWAGARAAFADWLSRWPDDGPAQVMVERIDWLAANPPGEGWDGVYEQRSK